MNKTRNLANSKEIRAFVLLSDCISFEHIEDNEYILKQLKHINKLKKSLSKELCDDIDNFIDKTINPIIYDLDYFDFMHKPEYGSYDENNHFVIKSEQAFDMLIYELCSHTVKLEKQLVKIFAKHIK